MGNSQELAGRRPLPPSSIPIPDLCEGRPLWLHSQHPRSPQVTYTQSAARRPGLSRWSNPAPTEIPDMSDFSISDQGSIFLIRPLNEAARQWLDENVVSEPWQWVQGALCVEACFARDLVIEIEEAGFEITR